MTPDEFREKMIAAQSADAEVAHSKMDELMCELLRELGYGSGVDVFDYQERWYA